MNQIEFLQNGLADAAKSLVITESALRRFAKALANHKCNFIENELIGKDFKAVDIVDRTNWETRGIKLDAMMRATVVNMELTSSYIGAIINENQSMLELTVTFQRDPDEILKSMTQLTGAEKDILKKMREYYNQEHVQSDGRKLRDINQSLTMLKHKYNMVCQISWKYSFDEILSPGFLTRGIRTNKIIIV